MKEHRDYTKSSFRLASLVVLMLLGISLIPPFSIGGIAVKRANILSDIIDAGDAPPVAPSLESILDTSFLEGFVLPDANGHSADRTGGHPSDTLATTAVHRPAQDTLPMADPSAVTAPAVANMHEDITRAAVENPELVAIEDFSPGERMMSRFYAALAHEKDNRVIRVAVLGDSFIESDIITADLREQLQTSYGGGGVGFVPFSTPLAKYRKTIDHTFSGWDYYNIMSRKSVPDRYRDKFFISGILSVPQAGAEAHFVSTDFRNNIAEAQTATLIFANPEGSTLRITLNDSLTTSCTPPAAEVVGHIFIDDVPISKLSVEVEDPSGFIGYGVVLEDSTGVSVHNFAVRSNSGLALFGTDAQVNTRIGELMNYDLVILQYGLNVMSADIFDYAYYERHLVRIIEYIKRCFPGSAILVMSVGDRSTLKSGTAVTMPEVHAMIKTQRNAAVTGGVAFWNTLDAMGGENSMPEYVKNKWAAKDHTHINYQGGRQIARELAAYIDAAVESVRTQDALKTELRAAAREDSIRQARLRASGAALADSLARVMIQRMDSISALNRTPAAEEGAESNPE